MNRFKRLANLRRIREEASGMAHVRVVGRMENLKQNVVKLDKATAEGRVAAQQAMLQSNFLPVGMVDDFLRGQTWRRERLEKMIVATQEDLDKTKNLWLAARVQLKQAESLAEKETLRQRHEAEIREIKIMDMIGVMRNIPFSGQEGAF